MVVFMLLLLLQQQQPQGMPRRTTMTRTNRILGRLQLLLPQLTTMATTAGMLNLPQRGKP